MIKEHRDSAEAFSKSCRVQYEARIADLEDKLRATQVSYHLLQLPLPHTLMCTMCTTLGNP